jgi:hypothetical protein
VPSYLRARSLRETETLRTAAAVPIGQVIKNETRCGYGGQIHSSVAYYITTDRRHRKTGPSRASSLVSVLSLAQVRVLAPARLLDDSRHDYSTARPAHRRPLPPRPSSLHPHRAAAGRAGVYDLGAALVPARFCVGARSASSPSRGRSESPTTPRHEDRAPVPPTEHPRLLFPAAF